jgi:hypothetical protein
MGKLSRNRASMRMPPLFRISRSVWPNIRNCARVCRIEKSLKHAEPVRMPRLRINHAYPEHVPLQSTPPTLLQNLPRLPPDIEYRIVGHDLTLLDAKANLIIDLIPNAIPMQLS